MMLPVANPALDAFVALIVPELELAQVLIRRRDDEFELRHLEDRAAESLRNVEVEELRAIAQFTKTNQFRPLKSAPTLQRGWRCVAHDALELDAALQGLYPGAVADWFAAQSSHPPITHYREFTSRQAGMYRITAMLTDEQAAQVACACCHPRFCLKRRLWTVEGLGPDPATQKSVVPCLEPCAVLLEFARQAMRLEQEKSPDAALPASEVETRRAALERALEGHRTDLREADFGVPENPRRLQLGLEQLKR